MLQTAAQQAYNHLEQGPNFPKVDIRDSGLSLPMRAPNRLQSIIDRLRPVEMLKKLSDLIIVNKAKILEIAYIVTIAITPTPESAQSHNGPLVTRNPIGGSQTILIRAKPLIVQNKNG